MKGSMAQHPQSPLRTQQQHPTTRLLRSPEELTVLTDPLQQPPPPPPAAAAQHRSSSASHHHHHHPIGVVAAAVPSPLSSTFVEKWTEKLARVPPRYKYGFVLVWILWKIVMSLAVLWLVSANVTGGSSSSTTSADASLTTAGQELPAASPLRILYIVTSLAEYNTGSRSTVKGQDRLAEVLLPVLRDGIDSIKTLDHVQVDVYLILAYTLSPERQAFIRNYISTPGLQIWDDACPIGYDEKKSKNGKHQLVENTRALARQHRYVIRDKLEHYDLFIAVEDDMRITADHVQHYLQTSAHLEQLRATIGTTTDQPPPSSFAGPLTARQLDRLVPGFVRVEVLLDPDHHGSQKVLDPIPLEYPHGNNDHFDPTYCCHLTNPEKFVFPKHDNKAAEDELPIPPKPPREHVVIWETSVQALAVRQLPKLTSVQAEKQPATDHSKDPYLDWIALLPGPGKRLEEADIIRGYWSGADGEFGLNATKPSPGEPSLIAQQGGWMATTEQIVRLQRLCQASPGVGSFLPPYNEPIYKEDGQASMNVEFWSGGYQFFTGVKGGCNMQRVVSLKNVDHFSKHFIYHVANNKQRQLSADRMVLADHLWGQLNTVQKRAAAVLAREQQQEQLQKAQ